MRTAAALLVSLSLGSWALATEAPAPPAAPGAKAPAGELRPGVRDLAGTLEAIRARHNIPAMGGGVVIDGKLVALGATGKRAADKPTPVTPDDLWHIGSCTKAMTATLCGVLVERNKLKWESTVADMFPELAPGMDPACRGITLRQLLNNRSGLTGDAPPDVWQEAWKTAPAGTSAGGMMIVKRMLAQPPKFKPGERDQYSNFGFTVAGMMAERAAGKPYEELLAELVFKPLGITHFGFGPTSLDAGAGEPVQPRGHSAAGAPVEPGPQADNPPAITPAGRVHISLEDWAKFVAAHAGNGPLLTPATWDVLHAPAAPGPDGYAMGWVTTHRPWAADAAKPAPSDRALWHNGSNTMWYCVTWFSPDRRMAVLVTTNTGSPEAPKAADEAAFALIQSVTPAPGK
jgi:CubicO group peptidase (beta-lactamase class C family)